ncbi:MAG: sialate O-acetylesterase [Planctomycetes bacterium]|nr:sialate O-acetylesterase [Planctomycetota bacterium]
MRSRRVLIAMLCALFVPSVLHAQITLPTVISDHMMLQRGRTTPIWGWASPGETVTVRFAGQTKQATADPFGAWKVQLDAMEASSEPREMEIEGKDKKIIKDILVGDVWICSGQSNMEFGTGGSINGQQEVASADLPMIRIFDVWGHEIAPAPRRQCNGQWRLCTPQTTGGFSAAGFFFGRKIQKETGVPIGLIGTNWGGTRIEPWIPPVGYHAVSELAEQAKFVDQFDPNADAGKAAWATYFSQLDAWLPQARTQLAAGRGIPEMPAKPGDLYLNYGSPTTIYNGMVAPLVPFGVRGALWYQGESNGSEGVEYFYKMKALIEGWRTVFEQPADFPQYFYFVQLANFQQPVDYPAGGDGWARIREAQRQTLTLPNTGMAVIIDIGEANDIHPKDKQDVGDRLARWALRDVYKKDVVVSGPLYRSMKIEEGKIRIDFDHVGAGLIVGEKHGLEPTKEITDGQLKRFAIAGEDKKWVWANAKIDGSSVLVWSDQVAKPVAVRYAYSMNPEGANLYNIEGLPASPFRTDGW